MEQFTPTMSNDNFSISNNFVCFSALGDKEKVIISPNSLYHPIHSNPNHSFFIRDLSWEYFSNELEFE